MQSNIKPSRGGNMRKIGKNRHTGGLSASMPPKIAYEEKILRSKLQQDDRSSSVPILGPHENIDAHQDKIRRKLKRDDRSSSMPISSSSAVTDADVAFEERLRRKIEGGCFTSGDESKQAARALAESYEVKVRRELKRDDRSSSMPISSSSAVTEAYDAFEERLRRKIEGGCFTSADESKQAARALAESYEVKVRRKLEGIEGANTRPGNFSSSIKEDAAFEEPPKLSASEAAVSYVEEKVRRKFKAEGRMTTSTRPKHLSSSMPINIEELRRESGYKSKKKEKFTKPKYTMFDGHALEDRRSVSLSNDIQHIGRGDSLQASSVSFDVIFTYLCQFQEENNGSLDIPRSHSSFLLIMDNLATMGMEELLKKRWDSQFVELKAFKREHGDLFIPASHPTLGAWVRDQLEPYKRFKKRLPSTVMTKKRFGKLEGIGFGQFVSWEEDGYLQTSKPSIQVASSLETDESEEENESEPCLILDEKIRRRKKFYNEVKFQERAAKAHASCKKNNEKTIVQEAISAELFEKRMLQRSVRRGLGKRQSSRFIMDDLEGGQINSDDDIDTGIQGKSKDEMKEKSLRRFSHLVRSTSASNLCPGSWECPRCSLINEPIGFEPRQSSCRACGVPNNKRNETSNLDKSFEMDEVVLQNDSNIRASKDDMFIGRWSQLSSVLANVANQSLAEYQSADRLANEAILQKEWSGKFKSTSSRSITN